LTLKPGLSGSWLELELVGLIRPWSKQFASIHAPEPQALVIQPWDPSITKDIEKAIMTSGLGINPVADGKIIRLPFPPMTEDRRLELTKLVNDKAEQAKVRLRTFREETIKKLKLQQKAGDISEDGLNLDLKNIQSQMDESTERINQQLSKKTSELMAI